MAHQPPVHIKTIAEFHRFRNLPAPEHPLVSVIDYGAMPPNKDNNAFSWVMDFYSISLKRDLNAKMKYGQLPCDFDEGVMFFMAPGQVFKVEVQENITQKRSGNILLVHPDFLWNTPLAKTIKQYAYFDYSVNEALFLSEKEESLILDLFKNISNEYCSAIDAFSQSIVVSQIELLLNYADRFYHRQFITRKTNNHQLLERLEALLEAYFNSHSLTEKGLPSVQYIAGELNVSPNYLSGLLKAISGHSTQQHIHDKLIEKAKEKLSTTGLSVSEIAYALGFGHPQSFSKLFKTKTNISPLEFRQGFN